MRGNVKHPRKIKHLALVMNYVEDCGGTQVDVTRNVHYRIGWKAGDRTLNIPLSCSPVSTEACVNNARQAVRREFRSAGIKVSA